MLKMLLHENLHEIKCTPKYDIQKELIIYKWRRVQKMQHCLFILVSVYTNPDSNMGSRDKTLPSHVHMYLLVLLSDPILIMKVSTLPLMIYWTNIMMKVFVFTSALLVLASADTCTDCTAVVSTIAARLMTEESIAAQQAILLSSMYLVGNLVKPTSIVSSIPHHNSLPSNQQILIG